MTPRRLATRLATSLATRLATRFDTRFAAALVLALWIAPSWAEPMDHAAHGHAPDPDSGAELIGQPAPAWAFDRWVRGGPLTLDRLRGRVVLVRWWTEGCHFCEETLPAIERLRREYPDMVVVGAFHPKPVRSVGNRHVLEVAKRLGYDGPIAFDGHWRTLERYWLDANPERNWTSVSFLIGRKGEIRWVHGGGEYHLSTDPRHARCVVKYHELESALRAALADSTGTPTRL